MNHINYESIMFKYGVTDLFMSDLATLMLKGYGLTNAKSSLSATHDCEHIDLKKLYVLATSIANSIMGEELSLVCPEMHAEREQLRSSAIVQFKAKRLHVTKEYSERSLESIFEEIEDAMFEIDEVSI